MATVNNSVVRLYQQWANSILCEAGIAVSSLEEFQSGALLTVLLDLLWPGADLQGKLQQQGLPDDLTEETTFRCIQSVLDYITSVGIRCQLDKKDVAHGDVKSLLDLLWILILHFTVHTPDKVAHQRTVKWGKKKLLEWCGDILDEFTPDLSLNLCANLCQNNYLTKLISAICDVQEDSDPVTHLANAFAAAEEQVGICKDLLDPSNVTTGGHVEEHSLLVYLALLRRKAKLLENLPPQWAAEAEGAGPAQGWNLPPEAMQAMGIDAGDYVMYAIVEETYLPPNYIPQDNYSGYPPQIAMDDPRNRQTAQISEIHSSDEEGSTKGESKGTDGKKEQSPSSMKSGGMASGGGAFDEMGRLKKKSTTAKKKRHVSFSDSTDSQERMSQSYNNLLLSDSPDEFLDPMMDPTQAAGFPYSEFPSTTYTTVPGGFIVTSTMMMPPGHPSDMFYSHPYAGYYPPGGAETMEQNQRQKTSAKPKKAQTGTRTPDVESAVNKSKSLRDDIQSVIAEANKTDATQMNKSKDSLPQSSSSGNSDIAVRGSDNDVSQASLDPLSSSAPVSDEEGIMILSTSQSDPEHEMNLQQDISHPHPRLTDDWMSSTFNKLLSTGSEVLVQTLAKAGGRSGLLQVMEDPNTDPKVADAIRQAITEQVQRQEQELKLLRSETTNSNAAMAGTNSEPSRSSMEISTSDDDNIDELLELLERIGQEGQNMQVELKKSFAREAYLHHEHTAEEDNMQGLMQRLTDEIQELQGENRRMQKQIKDMRDNQRSDKVSIMNLMSTIEDLRESDNKTTEDKTTKPLLDNHKPTSVSTMTDRRIVANTQSQTQSSISHMRDKVQQIAPVQTEKGTQVIKQTFQRSTLTSTQGLIKTRNAGIQARPMQGRFNVGLQVGGSAYRAKHVATQTGLDAPVTNHQMQTSPSHKLDNAQFSQLKDRIVSLETTLNKAQSENGKLTDRLEEALHLVKENLKTPSKVIEMSSVESENLKLRNQLDAVQNEKNRLVQDLNNLNEKSKEVSIPQVRQGWTDQEYQEVTGISSSEDVKASPNSSSQVKKSLRSSSRPGSPSQSRPPSPSGRPRSAAGRQRSHPMEKEGSQPSRPGSASPRRDSKPTPGVPARNNVPASQSSSPPRSRGSSNERSPTRSKDDITAKVQRELEKLFPRNRSSATPNKNESAPSAKKPEDVKPLLDADKLKGMSVDELRKKRLAMLVDSYTTKRVTDILQGDKTEQQPTQPNTNNSSHTRSTERDGRPATARGRRPSAGSLTLPLDNAESQTLPDPQAQTFPAGGQLPPWAQRRDSSKTNDTHSSPKYGDHDKNPETISNSTTSTNRTGRKSPSPEGSSYSSPPWRPPGPARTIRPTSGHSDSGVFEQSSVQSPYVESEQSKQSPRTLPQTAKPSTRTAAVTPGVVASGAQQDARNRARSALQRRLKSHLTNVAASAKPQISPRTSNVSPTRQETKLSYQRKRSSSSSSSSSVSDLIASLKDRSKPLKTSSREDLRSSPPTTVSKVTSDGTYISISEISPNKSEGRPQSAGRRRSLSSESSQSGRVNETTGARSARPGSSLLRQSSPRDSSRTDKPSPRGQSSDTLRHSRLASSQSDLRRSSNQMDSNRWAEPKHRDHDAKSELFRKRASSPRSQRIRSSLANLTKGHLGSERLTRSTSDLASSEEKVLLKDPGNIRPPSPNQSLDSSRFCEELLGASVSSPSATAAPAMVTANGLEHLPRWPWSSVRSTAQAAT